MWSTPSRRAAPMRLPSKNFDVLSASACLQPRPAEDARDASGLRRSRPTPRATKSAMNQIFRISLPDPVLRRRHVPKNPGIAPRERTGPLRWAALLADPWFRSAAVRVADGALAQVLTAWFARRLRELNAAHPSTCNPPLRRDPDAEDARPSRRAGAVCRAGRSPAFRPLGPARNGARPGGRARGRSGGAVALPHLRRGAGTGARERGGAGIAPGVGHDAARLALPRGRDRRGRDHRGSGAGLTFGL